MTREPCERAGKYTEVAGMGAADSFAPYPGQDIGEAQQQYDFGSFYASKAARDALQAKRRQAQGTSHTPQVGLRDGLPA